MRRQARLDAKEILPTLSLVTVAPPEELLDETSETQSVLDTGTSVANGGTCAECGMQLNSIFYVCVVCEGLNLFILLGEARSLTHVTENKYQITMCHDCAFRDTFNVIKEHDETHHLVKIKDRVQDTDGTSGEPIEGVGSSTLSSLSSRVESLAAMVESRFVELDRRLAELMEKVQLSLGSV